METATKGMISQEDRPILQLKRSLLPIDEYATREGVSKGIVEECGKLGIIQIRKYKGKTFVVDVPLSLYLYGTSETAAEQKLPTDRAIQDEKIDEFVQKVTPKAPILQKKNRVKNPDTPEIAVKPPEAVGKSVETKEEMPESVQTPQAEELSLDAFLAAQAWSKRTWQVVALFSLTFLLAAFLINIWFYMGRKVQLDKIEKAYASVQQSLSDSAEANQRAEALQNELAEAKTKLGGTQNELYNTRVELERVKTELDSSKAELKRLRNELANSRAEVRAVQDELTLARGDLEAIQRRNSGAVSRLNEQIQRLSTRLTELAKNNPEQ
jgi:peptidoglycan hydrolase CwlO-like protein